MSAAGRALLALLVTVFLPAIAGAQGDPRLRWQTLTTPHFHIHFYQDMEPIARRVGAVAERVVERLAGPLGHRQSQVTEVVLSDASDDANGSATAVPFNTVRLFVTAPDDLSVLQQYDDWIDTLVTHEYTHILHTDNISGVPAIVNAVLGKIWAPNQVQPRFILEGLATYEESLHTRGGRLRSSAWDMYLRADALAGRLLTLDQLAHGPNRWPHGNLWYLYGSYLMRYVAERFGAESLARLSREYGSMAAPWQLNRALRRVTGHTWEEVYADFTRDMTARFRAQRDALVAQGLDEGAQITAQGEVVRNPRYLRDGTLVYESSDGQGPAELRALSPATLDTPHPTPHALEWQAAPSGFGVANDRTLVVSDIAWHRDIYAFHDLYRWTLAPDGDGHLEAAEPERLTDGWRAQQPDVSPDGDHVVFTVNHRGTTSLFEMSLAERHPVPLFRTRRFEQVYAPRYSPDGRSIAFSYWRTGGYRDLAVYDRETHTWNAFTHDRALDLSPTYSPDGAYLLWTSDRSGVMNVYARDLRSGEVRQVTHVVGGAFQPVVSPDGRTLVYVGYTARGYDLFRMPFDPSRWRAPDEVERDPFDREDEHRPSALPDPASVANAPVTPYSPWGTLYPRNWMLEVASDGFGPQIAVRTQGADVVGRHQWTARVGVGLVRGDPLVDAQYVYRGMRPTLRFHLYRTVDAGGGYRIGTRTPVWAAERWGGESELSVGYPGVYDSHTLAISYEAQWLRAYGGFPGYFRYLDPNDAPPTLPFQGWVAGLRATWIYSRAQRFTYSITAQQGFTTYLSVKATDAVFGSDVGGFDASAAFTGYLAMPWGSDRRRHIVAVHVGAGFSFTDRGERGAFVLGGFPTFSTDSLLDAFRYGVQSGGIALRGYPVQARGGSQFQLVNLEYRFPLWQTQRGITTLPVFLQRVSGDAFVDAGNASFGRFRLDNVAVGAGLELLADIVMGYVLPFTVRVGYAHGFMRDGTDQFYGLLSAPF